VVARIAVAAVAVLVIGWLAVMERDVRLQARAAGAISAHRLTRAEDDLRRARLLNPDAAPDVTRAVAYRASGRVREAIELLEQVVRREPDNFTAWSVLQLSATGTDPATSRRALAVLRRLDPVSFRAR
jgi:predicted Zn-dependent protease